jgi:hypothetical protein
MVVRRDSAAQPIREWLLEQITRHELRPGDRMAAEPRAQVEPAEQSPTETPRGRASGRASRQTMTALG